MATPGPWTADGGYRNVPAQTETHTRNAVFEAVLFRTAGGWKADAVEAGMMGWRAGRTPAASSRGVAATPIDLRGRSEREPDFQSKSEEYRAWMDAVDAIAAEVGVTGADGRSFAETFWHDRPERNKLVPLSDIAKVVFSYDRRLGSDPALKGMAYACAGMIRLALAMERRRAWDAGQQVPIVSGSGLSSAVLAWLAPRMGPYRNGSDCLKSQWRTLS
jgi:hypothetical protein